MEININNEAKTLEIWLTNSEQTNPELQDSLKPVYAEYHEKKYLVAVFKSGRGDLFDGTRDLLLRNRVTE